jgi:hypothetical protein
LAVLGFEPRAFYHLSHTLAILFIYFVFENWPHGFAKAQPQTKILPLILLVG